MTEREEALLNDLLWALTAIQRLGYPGSIADLFDSHGLPSLKAEYEAVVAAWWPADVSRDAAERMGRA